MAVYTKLYTGSGGTPKNASAAIVVHDGKLNSVAIPFPSQGFITKLVVKQTAGTPKAFVVELLNSKIPFPVGEAAVATAAADDIELYRIIPETSLSGSSGQALEVINQEMGYPYLNVDAGYSDAERFIYLVIKPTSSSDDTTWDVAITAHDNNYVA